MKLLKRTVRSYLVYSALVLVIAVPLFYFIIQALCMQDVDHALRKRRSVLTEYLQAHPEITEHLPWHDLTGTMEVLPPEEGMAAEKQTDAGHYLTVPGGEEPFRELHTYITLRGASYPVVVRLSLIDIEDLIQGIVLTAVLLMALILGGLLWINRRQSRRLWKPFYHILDQLQHFSLNREPDIQYAPTDITEFSDLERAIRQLAGRARKSYLQQKEFTENAAHEIQTPLATLQARVEVLMQDESLTRQQSAHIRTLADAVARMTKLNRGLLLLAKIENNQFARHEAVPLRPMITRMLRQFEIQIRMKGLGVSESLEDCVVQADPVLMDILVSNLLNNAIQYAVQGTEVSVKLTGEELVVANAGPPMSFGEDRLFQRFQKGGAGREGGGTGLGLAIVRQVADSCGFSIQYAYRDHLHRFRVGFGA